MADGCRHSGYALYARRDGVIACSLCDLAAAEARAENAEREALERAAKVCLRYLDQLYEDRPRDGRDIAANALQNCANQIRALSALPQDDAQMREDAERKRCYEAVDALRSSGENSDNWTITRDMAFHEALRAIDESAWRKQHSDAQQGGHSWMEEDGNMGDTVTRCQNCGLHKGSPAGQRPCRYPNGYSDAQQGEGKDK